MLTLLKDLLNQVRSTKRILFFVILLFLVANIVGYTTADYFASLAEGHLKEFSIRDQRIITSLIDPQIKLKRNELKNPKLFKYALRIFLHNSMAAGIIIYGGIFFGIIPVVNIFGMGYLLGLILRRGGWRIFLVRIFPHGIFELPLILIIAYVSLSFGVTMIRAKKNERKQALMKSIKTGTVLYLTSIPFFFIAAILESYGTRLLWGN